MTNNFARNSKFIFNLLVFNTSFKFIKFYIGNEINPNLKKFLDTNAIWKQFFNKNKQEFKDIRERLVEISHKLGMSVTDFKRLVSRVQKGEKESRIVKM